MSIKLIIFTWRNKKLTASYTYLNHVLNLCLINLSSRLGYLNLSFNFAKICIKIA